MFFIDFPFITFCSYGFYDSFFSWDCFSKPAAQTLRLRDHLELSWQAFFRDVERRNFFIRFRSTILWLQNYLHLHRKPLLLIDSIPISFFVVLNKYLMEAGMSGLLLLCLRAFDNLIYDFLKSTRDEWWLANHSSEVCVKFNGET